MTQAVISSSGLYTPEESISNEELVTCFNQYVDGYNAEHAAEIEAGKLEALAYSSSEFIYKASGIKSRYTVDKAGILDPEFMRPRIPKRGNDEPSLMCEMALVAAKQALEAANRDPADVDMVIAACSNLPRGYPALAVEVQHYLGASGFGFDMNVACATAAFGIQTAVDAIRNGSAKSVLMVNPEICTAHLNFRDRDCHFIFGDVCTAALIEAEDFAGDAASFKILGTRLSTQFSNNIRNNYGFLNPSEVPPRTDFDRLFKQNGRKVFREVTPLVADLVGGHVSDVGVDISEIKRLWLHQANINMNKLISKRVYGREATEVEMPSVLHEYGNTSSASPIIVFNKFNDDLQPGDVGVLCGFGAGYSAGSVVLRRV